MDKQSKNNLFNDWRYACIFTLLLDAALITSSLLAVGLFHFNILTADEWSIYDRFLNQPLWHSLWNSWNGHRLVFPGILQYANMVWFGANLSNLIFVRVAVIIFTAWLVSRSVRPSVSNRSAHWFHFVMVLAFLLWMGNHRAMLWAFGLTYTLGILGAVSACYSMARSRTADGEVHWRWLMLALAGATLATFSWGGGLAMWPVLILLALGLRLPRTAVLTVFVCSVGVVTAYFTPTPAEGGEFLPWVVANAIVSNGMLSNLPSFFQDHGKVGAAAYVLYLEVSKALGVLGSMPAHLALPFFPNRIHAIAILARIAGLLSLVLFGGLACFWWRMREARCWLLPILGIALFCIGNAVLISLARYIELILTGHPNYGQADRFCIFSSLLWAGLFCGYAPLVMMDNRRRRK